jgi:hypothetical protein
MSVSHIGSTVAMVESGSGSLIYDDRTKYLNYDKHSSVGKGGLLIEPYLDLNGNGRRDPGEPLVSGVTIRINGGIIQSSRKHMGRIVVCFYRSDRSLAGQAITEADGSFDFAGLAPGAYTAEVSPGQLEKLHLICRL